uniref:Putative secreted protein n=1 Tax=Panstrongylus lignarius TaxID=156445 RepID=A0A224Y2E9_9HEMI
MVVQIIQLQILVAQIQLLNSVLPLEGRSTLVGNSLAQTTVLSVHTHPIYFQWTQDCYPHSEIDLFFLNAVGPLDMQKCQTFYSWFSDVP